VLWSFWARFLIEVKILEMQARQGTAASGVVAQEHATAEVADSPEKFQ